MYKQLSAEQQEKIINTAICEFADKGYSNSSVSRIAKGAGVSVGVIYKYYEDKAALFNACIKKSIALLVDSLKTAGEAGGSLYDIMRRVIRSNISFAKSDPDYIRMYHTIVSGDTPEDASNITKEIEKAAADTYISAVERAKKHGEIRADVDTGALAMFFDNMMMMLHFSYACDYYKERYQMYVGEDIFDKDSWMEEQLMLFFRNGFGTL